MVVHSRARGSRAHFSLWVRAPGIELLCDRWQFYVAKGLLQVRGHQVGVSFCSFRVKLLAFRKFDGSGKVNYSS
ncbi:hypothetical protein GW17_00042800 [Ensete ventricosum]|nr:hypothetical protein GW17_00042800 [Ensete ventricosum]